MGLLAIAWGVLALAGCGAKSTRFVDGGGHGDGDSDTDDDIGCRPGETVCVGTDGRRRCVVLETDENHCGACRNACLPPGDPRGWTCNGGACSCSAAGPAALCGGTAESTCCDDGEGEGAGPACVDTTTSDRHCGGCGASCASGSRDVARADHCEGGICVCGDLGVACDGTIRSTCCVAAVSRCANLLVDESDCGMCGLLCQPPVGDRCRNGQCVCGLSSVGVDAVPCPESQECCITVDPVACVPAGTCI